MKINIAKGKAIETDDETIQRLEDICDDMELDLIQIKADLGEAKADLITTGEYVDPVWFRKAQTAKSLIGHNRGVLQRALKRKKAVLIEAERNNFERRFIDAAKIILSEETFKEIIRVVKLEDMEFAL